MAMMSRYSSPVVILLIYLCACSGAENCGSGWFGSKCQFKCHCDPSSNCDAITGQCRNPSKCAEGWFGSACQFQDLVSDHKAQVATTPYQSSNAWITDRNDTTCNADAGLQRVEVVLATTLPFTWLRVSLKDDVHLGNISVLFKRVTQSNSNCIDQTIYIINTNTIDIRCQVIVDTTTVIIEGHGVKSLCSLYISGGRNFALRQKTYQTSTYTDNTNVNASASNAVDGNIGTFSSSTCTHTVPITDPNPSWTVTFDHYQVLNRILLYNRNEFCCEDRLKHFQLQSFNSNGTIFSYEDESNNVSTVYSVIVTENKSTVPVNKLIINFKDRLDNRILTLCEVEAYGECVPGSWGLECNNTCSTPCNSQCNVETGACQVCNGPTSPSACNIPCQTGRFGQNCQYQCHCAASCDSTTGQCLSNSKCSTGWFGNSCQYEDLVTTSSETTETIPAQASYTWITDRNDSTCNTDDSLESVKVLWSTSFPFTWLRVTFKDIVNLGFLKVSFATNTPQLYANCTDQRFYLISTNTIDIRCKVIVGATSVIIEGQGVKSLCSLYISGGRNVALSQKASQTSTYTATGINATASNAVDGNKSGVFSENTCTHTTDDNPSWNVTFDHYQVLNRIVLYNRNNGGCDEQCGDRIKFFTLESFNSSKTVFHYDNPRNENYPLYDVTVTQNESETPVIGLTINLNRQNNNKKKTLTLCEVEAYGECVPGTWDLNCDKWCSISCSSTCNVETGTCQVCYGYKNPPLCTNACEKGTWGLSCGNMCSIGCWESSCNSVTGFCDRGCNGYTDFPNCVKECDSITWGLNCTRACDSSCFNSSCDRTTGVCNLGCNGYSNPPNCTEACDKGTWGLNCSKSCNTSCWNNSCNHSTGVCDEGCNGYRDFPECTLECLPGNWGQNCTSICSSNCFNSSCDKLTSKCNKGCNGYSDPPACTNACEKGNWGRNCSTTCNNSCWNNSCNRFNGTCDEGCNGYKDFPNCTLECDPGQSGLNCTNRCGYCYNKTCNSQTGICINGCDGYSNPPVCSTPCDHGLWGLNCQENCPESCLNKSCDKKTGECDKGCDGYNNPPNCDVVCIPGLYGINCSSLCKENCWNGSCDHKSGQCDKGCNGYKDPPTCIEDCENTYWGKNCQANCSSHCFNTSCNSQTSECRQGCHAGFAPPTCVEALIVASPPDDPAPIGAIVGPILAVIVISVLIFAGVMFWRKRRAFKKAKNDDGDVDDGNESKRLSNYYQMQLDVLQKKRKDSINIDDTESYNAQGIYNNEDTNFNLQITSIPMKDLYTFMHSHNKEYFEQQFKNIPVPTNVTTEVGMSSQNKHKNRYKNICTYDHSRVHLEINTSKNEGDYINASYIKSLKSEDQFIASQGPNNIMLNDFVRMLWEQQVEKVVMLTNLIEEGTMKCEKYWPDEATRQFGEFQMKLISTQTFSDYVIRVLELSKPSEAGRIFTQFHFTSWPDKGVPSAPWGLVDFEQRVSFKPTSRPIVVHCSAGVGRTGTFIALSKVLREAEKTGQINCFKTAVKLRQDRVLMIQTAEQYWFLHRAAQVAIVCIGTTVTSYDITGRIKKLDETTTTGKTKLEEEFKAVCDVCNEFVEEPQVLKDSSTEDSNVYNNIEEMADRFKNRFINIIPKQKYRPFLACENQNMGDYINAVFLPGFKKKDQQLLTQLPMPKTIIDFWRMVIQYKISLIVAFELDAMANDETLGQYLPAGVNKTLNCSPYLVKINDVKSSSLCDEQKLTVEVGKPKSLLSLSSSDQSSQSVIHLKCLFTDFNPVKLLRFIRQVRSYNALANGRILYTCSNGAKYSGLACVLSLLLDRMEHDSCLTVPLVVGTIKTIRPEVISTVDQYRVLYQVLQKYSDNSVQYESLWSIAGNSAVLSTTKNPAFDESQDTDANIYANV